MNDKKETKVQSSLGGYYLWALKGYMAGTGDSESAAIKFVVKDWMTKNQDFLASQNLSLNDYRRQQLGEAEILNMPARRVAPNDSKPGA